MLKQTQLVTNLRNNMRRWTAFEELHAIKLTEWLEKKEAEHIPSGKLSAGQLAKPLLWQILKSIGVPAREIDFYTRMTFERGHQVEAGFIRDMREKMGIDVEEQQQNVEYRGVVGKIDAKFKWEDKPYLLEIKSVKYAKYKRIEEEVDEQYRLQATLYGMALKMDNIAIAVIDTQTLIPKMFYGNRTEHSRQIEGIIDAYNTAIKRKFMPVFEPTYKWQSKPEYQDYPEFSALSSGEIIDLLKVKYPQAYEKWTGEKA